MYTTKWIGPGEDTGDAFAVRVEVFVHEQEFSLEIELDDIDPIAHHLVFYDESGEPVACGRMFPDGDGNPGTYIIGRVAVRKKLRGTGVGRDMMLEMEGRAKQLGATRISLGAQCQAQPFYQKLGYAPYGEVYMDEHCPHIHMQKAL